MALLDKEVESSAVVPAYIATALTEALTAAGVEANAKPAENENGDAPPAEGNNNAISVPAAPLLVFINSKSGGRLGPDLFNTLTSLIGTAQVFELSKAKPTVVIPAVVETLNKLVEGGDQNAALIRERLRVIVAGGDGTVGWMLSTVEELSPPPPVAVIPLGTGNDLSRSFRWGPTFSSASTPVVKKRLLDAITAKTSTLDSWQLKVTPPEDMDLSQLHLPYALHKKETEGEPTNFTGTFYNYFSMGMDAQVAYGFHHLRNEKPWLARGRYANQLIYGSFGCTQGWFCTACAGQTYARTIHMVARIFVKKTPEGEYEEVNLPSSLRAIILLNLQSYAGGRNPWGLPPPEETEKEGWVSATPNDGVIEIVGLRNGWHTALVMAKVSSATRIAQGYAVKLELRGEHSNSAYLQLDGEPWQQVLDPDSRSPTIVEITRKPIPSIMLKPAEDTSE